MMFGLIRIPIGRGIHLSLEERLDLALSQIGVRSRIVNVLETDNIRDVRGLIQCTAKQLLSIPNFGEIGLREVKDALDFLGLEMER